MNKKKKFTLGILHEVADVFYDYACMFCDILIKIFIMLGAMCSMILLYKLYPVISASIMIPFFTLFKVMLYVILVYFLICAILLCVILFKRIIEERNIKYEKSRKKSIDEIVSRLKEEDKE